VLLLNDRYNRIGRYGWTENRKRFSAATTSCRGLFAAGRAMRLSFDSNRLWAPSMSASRQCLSACHCSATWRLAGEGHSAKASPSRPTSPGPAACTKPDCKGSTTRTEAGSGNIKGETTRLGVGRAAASLPRRERPQKSLKSGFLALPHGAMQSERPTFRLADDSGNTASRCLTCAAARLKAQPCGT